MKPMTKLYRNIALAAFVLTASMASAAEPAFMHSFDPWQYESATPAATELEAVNNDEITIKAEGRKITISGAEDETLDVFNIAGVKVASYTIDSPSKTISLTVPRGVYILRVGKVARKVNIL